MDNELNQFRQREREEAASRTEQRRQAGGREFASVEEALQADCAEHPPPAHLAGRVSEAVQHEPPQPVSWWARWFGKTPRA